MTDATGPSDASNRIDAIHAIPFATRQPTLNHVWSSLLLHELYRLGVRDVALASGSRSTPLTMAAAAHPGLCCHRHFDERGLGFLALGLARGSQRPVAVITTSGTAVANLWPAVAEARLSGVPLILLTADRPPELIDNGSNQAMPQAGLFAQYPVYQIDLPCPTTSIAPAFVLATIDQAIAAQHHTPGPVHLNCRYPEPLYPGPEPLDFSTYLAPLGAWLDTTTPWCRWPDAPLAGPPQAEWSAFSGRRGLVVAGRIDDHAAALQVAALAERLGWPLIADLQSQIRFDNRTLTHADLALQDSRFAAELGRAEVLLQFGARLISKRLGHFIRDHAWQDYWLIEPTPARLDPDYRVRRRLQIGASAFALQHPVPNSTQPWHRLPLLQARTSALVEAACGDFGELGVCNRLAQRVEGQLVVGNSLAVRLMDMLGHPRDPETHSTALHPIEAANPLRIMANRGASGIDGLIASACGCALRYPGPTTLLLGDLSALHDLNSLALLRQSQHPFVVIVLNNDGGSIFHMLPVPDQDGLLDTYYRLPHGLDFAHAAALFGLRYVAPATLDAFDHAYRDALREGVTLIEIRVPSQEVAERLKALGAAIRGT